jgi:hypothetical protein
MLSNAIIIEFQKIVQAEMQTIVQILLELDSELDKRVRFCLGLAVMCFS